MLKFIGLHKTLSLTLLTIGLVACQSMSAKDRPLIDVQKVCGEEPKLVERIMVFRESQFKRPDAKKYPAPKVQIWELNSFSGSTYGLEWLKLTFKKNKLQKIEMGPRGEFAEDMKKLGVNLYFVRSAKGKEIEDYDKGPFQIKGLGAQSLTLTHNGSDEPGLSVTCFK